MLSLLKRQKPNTENFSLKEQKMQKRRRRSEDDRHYRSLRPPSALTDSIPVYLDPVEHHSDFFEDLFDSNQKSTIHLFRSFYRMEISLEFCGGAESHNKGEKYTTINVDSAEDSDVTLKDLFIMLRHNKVCSHLCTHII